MPLLNDRAELYDHGLSLCDLCIWNLLTAFSLAWLFFFNSNSSTALHGEHLWTSFRMSCLSSDLSSFTTKAYTLSICKVFRINLILLRSFHTSQGLVLDSIFFLSWGGWNLQNSSLGETSSGLCCLSLWSSRQNRSLNSKIIIQRMHVLQNNDVKLLENMECKFHFFPPFLCVQEWEIHRTFLCPDA